MMGRNGYRVRVLRELPGLSICSGYALARFFLLCKWNSFKAKTAPESGEKGNTDTSGSQALEPYSPIIRQGPRRLTFISNMALVDAISQPFFG